MTINTDFNEKIFQKYADKLSERLKGIINGTEEDRSKIFDAAYDIASVYGLPPNTDYPINFETANLIVEEYFEMKKKPETQGNSLGRFLSNFRRALDNES